MIGPDIRKEPGERVERFKTIELTYAGRKVRLPDLADYAKFYRKLTSGIWEPRTFAVLERFVDEQTVYVDIGAWIGVTPFWAAQTAKTVIAVEPDPRCHAILQELAERLDNVTVLHGALSSESAVTIHAVDGFGSSETSVLAIGDGDSVQAAGLSMDRIMALTGEEPCFVKIDIEGYEYFATSEIAKLKAYPVRGVQLAVHPQLLESSLKGNRLSNRLKVAWMTWRLSRVLGGLFSPPSMAKYGSVLIYIAKGVIFIRKPKGTDFVFERSHPLSTGHKQ